TGISPSIAFNLATPAFFALSLTTAFAIGYNLTERIGYGLVTAFFVAIAGNLVGFLQLMDILIKENVINNLLDFNYWPSSRVIPDTINEFPFFSFLQGDVHAHMISITFQLLIILFLLNVFRSSKTDVKSLFFLGLSLGFLYPLNTWDYPVYLFLVIIVIALNFLISEKSAIDQGNSMIRTIISIIAVLAISFLLYLPYHFSYKIERAISIVPSGRTSLIYYLAIFGFFLFLIFRFIILKSKRSGISPKYLIAGIFLVFMLSALMKFELLVLLFPLLVLAIFSILKEKDRDHAFVLILIIIGIFISLFCELFYIQDALGTGNAAFIRLNTIFKLYLQNWILWGIASGYIVFHFRDSFYQKRTWSVVAALLILMVSVYPVFATIGRSGGFRGEPTLDGEAYVKKEHPQDYMAIQWFKNITGEPIVLQAPGELYKWNTVITAFTGLPAVSGLAGHELDWRPGSQEKIDTRFSDVNRMYTSLNLDEVNELLKKYSVSYIYFGEAEGRKYSSPGLFDAHPERFVKVFEYGDVVVYRVKK
ncbi:MAG: hypothetical protein J5U17_02040, partial [Candidatus Methanoperedens sp.]|nr:hypothetical protein [Candidatus Methanoperedens sp.]